MEETGRGNRRHIYNDVKLSDNICILTFVVRVLSICFFERDLRESLILLPKNYPVWIPKKQISSKTPRTGALLTFVPASPGQGLREGCTLACPKVQKC